MGRPRDIQGLRVAGLHPWHDQLLRDDPLRPGRSVKRATAGHAQAAQPLTDAQREAIVGFETTLFTAQVFDDEAGELTARGALGGPQYLSGQDFYFGINDVVSGDYRTGATVQPDRLQAVRRVEHD